ncbi:Gfo/Idh/MocA family protein [Haliangium ochraceum]|uniref:Oxidoreductase domain protein n=1 Tax=Haliangium ochraceum (strain DSM 14365 / JCM 11303 / SMP-2) TaxID=502025 RepID=D0LIR9_HALO1|nr:Gfo/Idh/MocA family oxidoreductase [Haliangium ochraceum]ACY12948.1 oxidoreductase domain protein [Haliangium ochraceum DSM 14365]
MASTSRIRIAIAGIGYWGINWVRTLAREPGAKVTWLCDPEPAGRQRGSLLAPDARQTATFEDLLDADDVDAIVLATPAVAHAKQCLAALAADKHVLVEKPLALTEEDGREVQRAAQASERVLMVGHLMLYHPAVEHLATLIERGELGDIRYLYANRVNLGRARRDENALWSFGPHDVSMIDYLLGASPNLVWAKGESYLRPGVEDVVFLHLGFPERRMAHIHLSWLDPRKERRLTVVGSRKMVVFDDVSAEKLRIYDKGYEEPPPFTQFGEYLAIRTGGVYIPHLPMTEPLAVECAHFLECIRHGLPPRTGVDSALRVVRVLATAQRSLEQGSKPLLLNNDTASYGRDPRL